MSKVIELTDKKFRKLLPKRAKNSDKRSAGAPLIIAGSTQFPGAAILCALGAARTGAGYVTVATSENAAPLLRMHLIEQVVITFPKNASADEAVDEILDVAKRNGSIGIGPGLGLDERTGEIVRGILNKSSLPIVADASALFHLAKNLNELRGKPIVLTPHEGEFARLSGKGTISGSSSKGDGRNADQNPHAEERERRLREFVDRTGITTLLKGNETLIYDGTTMHRNPTGTNALATAGTGDVLTGIIATLLSQGLSLVDAARAGAYWHGLAGRVAAQHYPIGVIARDVIEMLPLAAACVLS